MTGNNGEVLRQLDLSLGGAGWSCAASPLRPRPGAKAPWPARSATGRHAPPRLYVSTSDAGAVLRFLDTYGKIQGGTMWVIIDPPRGDNTPQNGVINLRDFVIRGETRPRQPQRRRPRQFRQGGAGHGRVREGAGQFPRTTGKITIRDGAIWGPVAGVTVEGSIDFTARAHFHARHLCASLWPQQSVQQGTDHRRHPGRRAERGAAGGHPSKSPAHERSDAADQPALGGGAGLSAQDVRVSRCLRDTAGT